MSNPEEKSEKLNQNNKSKEEKIYIPEDEENIEEIDEEENDVEELDEEDSQAEIRILDDNNSNKNLKKKKKRVKKDSDDSEYFSSEESHKDKNTSTLNENENENENDPSGHLKRKRRRRKELEGPGHTCPDCGKCYFSLPALNMHRRTKHEYLKGDWGRGRGRPKKEALVENNTENEQLHEIKNENDNVISYSFIENKVRRFFEGEHRRPVYGEIINKSTILNIISEYKKNYMGIINDISEDNLNSNFFVKIVEEWENKKHDGDKKENENDENMTYINLNEKQNENKKKSFDFALIKYFKECAHFTNIHFLKTIYIILNLFREGINNYFSEMKSSNTNSSSEGMNEEKLEGIYTEKNNCDEKIPDIINEIIIKYFEPNSFFAFKQKDVKDIILHFFHWLYSYNYTDKKVTYS